MWWRKKQKMTLPAGSIIPKVDMDTQVPSKINPCEAVAYIDSSHSTYLKSRRSVGTFVISLFG